MKIGESFVLQVEGMEIHVTCKRVKNINCRIDPKGAALMSVPPHVSRSRAEEVALQHAGWFRDHMDVVGERKREAPRAWQSGETAYVWGERRTLRVERTDGVPSCAVEGDELVLRVPESATASYRQLLVENWYQRELIDRLKVLLPACEERIGVYATNVTVRRMKSRWGSCTHSTGRIRINTALAECPPACTEMVLVHELCHIIEANHGPRFKALMDLHCPDWRVSKRWLDEHSPRA